MWFVSAGLAFVGFRLGFWWRLRGPRFAPLLNDIYIYIYVGIKNIGITLV